MEAYMGRFRILCKGLFTLADSNSYRNSYEMYKIYTKTNSDDSFNAKVEFHFHSVVDIVAKLGTVAIGIGIGIGASPVETVLHIILLSLSTGIGIRIGVRQCKHAMGAQTLEGGAELIVSGLIEHLIHVWRFSVSAFFTGFNVQLQDVID